jgi:hypothetical protein
VPGVSVELSRSFFIVAGTDGENVFRARISRAFFFDWTHGGLGAYESRYLVCHGGPGALHVFRGDL